MSGAKSDLMRSANAAGKGWMDGMRGKERVELDVFPYYRVRKYIFGLGGVINYIWIARET